MGPKPLTTAELIDVLQTALDVVHLTSHAQRGHSQSDCPDLVCRRLHDALKRTEANR